jgi:hypothetical protein
MRIADSFETLAIIYYMRSHDKKTEILREGYDY